MGKRLLFLPGKIAITNPKIITTKSNAEYAADTLDVNLGDEVGYKYRKSPSNSYSDKTRLLYLTDGTLLSSILNGNSLLSEYYSIIIDEAHERQIQIDMLLFLIKEIISKRSDLKLIIMSATIKSEIFKDYFDIKGINYGELDIYKSANYHIDHFWYNNINKDYLITVEEVSRDIIKKSEKLLVFVPTQKDTFKCCELITKKDKKVILC